MSKKKPKPKPDKFHQQAVVIATDLMTSGRCDLASRLVLEGSEPDKRDLGGRNFDSVVSCIEKNLRIIQELERYEREGGAKASDVFFE